MMYLYKTIILLVILNLKLISTMPQSPCPQIFKYKMKNGISVGEINIVIDPNAGQAMLELKFTLARYFENDYQGKIELVNDREVEDSLNNNRPVKLTYEFTFPFQNVLPVIEYIKMNDLVYCIGTPDPQRKVGSTFTHRTSWSDQPVTQPNYPIQPITQPTTERVTRPSISIPSNPVQEIPDNDICGKIPLTTVQLVVNGEPAGPQPWLVSLYEGTSLNYEYFCAGNLITDKHVITAAHCLKGKTDIYMKVGAKSLTSKLEPNIKIRTNEKIYISPDYVHPSSHGDIGIILLNEPVIFANNIRPLCLWQGDPDLNKIVGDIGTVVGWGKNENGDLVPEEPRKANVRIVSQEKCRAKDLLKPIISDKTFCGTGATHFAGPCLGDSGGAFSIFLNKRWVIRGIISATVGDENSGICDVENYYSVYADVAKHKDWIQSILNSD